VSAFDEFRQRNHEYAASGGLGDLTPVPRSGVLIVTCLDTRVEPAAFLGVDQGDAMVIRNGGGRITDSTIAEIALVGALRSVMGAPGAPLEVAIVHHTQCGTGRLADQEFRRGFAARTGLTDDELRAAAVIDPHITVRADVERLRSAPMAADGIVVSGHVLDLKTGLVATVVPAEDPQTV
jgi:carbonic anhydrase